MEYRHQPVSTHAAQSVGFLPATLAYREAEASHSVGTWTSGIRTVNSNHDCKGANRNRHVPFWKPYSRVFRTLSLGNRSHFSTSHVGLLLALAP
jgi:hypothetical protein